jgi:hypothetical protein
VNSLRHIGRQRGQGNGDRGERDPNAEGLKIVLFAQVEQEHVLHIVRAQLVCEFLCLYPPEALGALVACRDEAQTVLNLAHIRPGIRLGLNVSVSAEHLLREPRREAEVIRTRSSREEGEGAESARSRSGAVLYLARRRHDLVRSSVRLIVLHSCKYCLSFLIQTRFVKW